MLGSINLNTDFIRTSCVDIVVAFRHASSSELKQHEGIAQDGFQFVSEWPLQDVYKELEWSTPMSLRLPELVMDVNTQIGALRNGLFQ